MDSEKVAERLILYRADRGWTQGEVARRAGVHYSTISLLEVGHHEPRRVTLNKLALAFGVSLEEFLSDRPPKAAGPSLPLPVRILRSEAGHEHLTRSMAATIAEAQDMSTAEIKQRIRLLAEEARVLRTAAREPSEYLPEFFDFSSDSPHVKDKAALKHAQEELRSVASGLVARVYALAEEGGRVEGVAEEAERVVAEDRERSEEMVS